MNQYIEFDEDRVITSISSGVTLGRLQLENEVENCVSGNLVVKPIAFLPLPDTIFSKGCLQDIFDQFTDFKETDEPSVKFTPMPPKPRTLVWALTLQGDHSTKLMGQIRYYGHWRQYCLFPEPEPITPKNLLCIINFLKAHSRDRVAHATKVIHHIPLN